MSVTRAGQSFCPDHKVYSIPAPCKPFFIL